MQASAVILTLKAAVIAVTLLLAGSITAVSLGKYRLHGRINMVFFVLTLSAVLGLEVIAHVLSPGLFSEYFDLYTTRMVVHLCFSLPAAALLPLMLYTGLKHHRWLHVRLACVFLVLWTGTFITGVFFLPDDYFVR